MKCTEFGSKHEIIDHVDGVLEIAGDYIYVTVNVPCEINIQGAFCHVHCVNGCKVSMRADRADNIVKVGAGTEVFIDGQRFVANSYGHYMSYEGTLRSCVRNGNEWLCLGELVNDYGQFQVYNAYRQGAQRKVYIRGDRYYNFVGIEDTLSDIELDGRSAAESYEQMCHRIRAEGMLDVVDFRRITDCCYSGAARFMTRWGKQPNEKVNIHESLILLNNEREIIKRMIGEDELAKVEKKYINAVRGGLE